MNTCKVLDQLNRLECGINSVSLAIFIAVFNLNKKHGHSIIIGIGDSSIIIALVPRCAKASIDVIVKLLVLNGITLIVLVIIGIMNARDCGISVDFLQQSFNLIGGCGLIDEVCGLFYTISIYISIGVGTIVKMGDF